MIQILTLFLGLATGLQPVDLRVAEAVHRVEIYLDDDPVSVLEGPPWSFALDLGPALAPHRLTAIAFDREGRELEFTQRLINVGALAAEFSASGGESDSAEHQNLTAVAVELELGHKIPAAQQIDGWFFVRGEPVKVHHVETGPAELVVVRDPVTQPWLEHLTLLFKTVKGETSLRFLSPLAAPNSAVEGRMQVFNATSSVDANAAGILFHAARLRPLEFAVRQADAIALAGLETHAGNKRRAVLALVGDPARDHSHYPPEQVRSYLAALGVPLFVWTFGEPAPRWKGREIHTRIEIAERLRSSLPLENPLTIQDEARKAFGHLRESLLRQRIVWLHGNHLPQDVELSPRATGIRLAGRVRPGHGEVIQ